MQFRTAQFEGPLSLLLALLEEQKLAITDVALAEVTEQFLAVLEQQRDRIAMAHLADFLQTATQLLLLKSRALLPYLVPQQEAEDEDGDPAALAAQLALYKRFVEAAHRLRPRLAGPPASVFRHTPPRKQEIVFAPPASYTAQRCAADMRRVLHAIPRVPQLERERLRAIVAVRERMVQIVQRLRSAQRLSFRALVGRHARPADVVVAFLAVLELYKRADIIVRQQAPTDDLLLTCDTLQT